MNKCFRKKVLIGDKYLYDCIKVIIFLFSVSAILGFLDSVLT